MNSELLPPILLIAAWFVYGAIHSLLASHTIQQHLFQRWPKLKHSYRLIYNAIAVVTLIPPLLLLHLHQSVEIIAWPDNLKWLSYTLTGLATGGFLWSLKYYDMKEFLGIRQWRNSNDSEINNPQFVISPPHRYVRHPWYSFALVILWTQEMDLMMLISVTAISIYFYIGSLFEERKLVETLGDVYSEYQKRVPRLVPSPWKHLTEKEAERLSAPISKDY